MARATSKIRVETPYIARPNARRQLAIRQLYRLNREFDTQIAALNRRRRLGDTTLMTLAALSLIMLGGFMMQIAPRCTDGANIPTISIGGAIKVAGC
jgi:hypothetical protein